HRPGSRPRWAEALDYPMAEDGIDCPIDRAQEDEKIAARGRQLQGLLTELTPGNDEHRARESTEEPRQFQSTESLLEQCGGEQGRPERDQSDAPARAACTG